MGWSPRLTSPDVDINPEFLKLNSLQSPSDHKACRDHKACPYTLPADLPIQRCPQPSSSRRSPLTSRRMQERRHSATFACLMGIRNWTQMNETNKTPRTYLAPLQLRTGWRQIRWQEVGNVHDLAEEEVGHLRLRHLG